jgi:uncharacterized protein YndB with AHSA1/START domain
MSGLFSYPSDDADMPSDRPDIRVSVTVPAPADHAWAGLTEHLHLWWPADLLSRWGEGSFFDLEDNALVETSAQDDENVWGEMKDSVPGTSMLLTWRHAGSSFSTELRLEMEAGSADGTALVLMHGGWTSAEPEELYQFYREFWPTALARYRRFMGAS